jgi:hypothetical protein
MRRLAKEDWLILDLETEYSRVFLPLFSTLLILLPTFKEFNKPDGYIFIILFLYFFLTSMVIAFLATHNYEGIKLEQTSLAILSKQETIDRKAITHFVYQEGKLILKTRDLKNITIDLILDTERSKSNINKLVPQLDFQR